MTARHGGGTRSPRPPRPPRPPRALRVLVLGGTAEARALAGLLHADARFDTTSSLAGRTAAPALPAGRNRTGGFGGAAGLAGWLRAHRVDALVDATHPFAATISRNAADAAAATGVPLLVLRRPGWTAGPGDDWHWTGGLADAAGLLPRLGTRAFLTVGRQDLAALAGLRMPCVARCVEPPGPPLPADCRVLLARGPFTVAGERAVLREHGIDVVLTKDSGGPSTAAKLTAAREARLPVVLVRRPPAPEGVRTVETPAAAADFLRTLL